MGFSFGLNLDLSLVALALVVLLFVPALSISTADNADGGPFRDSSEADGIAAEMDVRVYSADKYLRQTCLDLPRHAAFARHVHMNVDHD